jgi:regulator of protease activity HflC (stomatin/prohibitin superfamily)
MLGFRYLKNSPTIYTTRYSRGKLVSQGTGQSYFYFAPLTTLVSVNMASIDAPFMFEEVTRDLQEVIIQGQLTYRVKDAQVLASVLDHTLDQRGKYISDDPTKIQERLTQAVQVLSRGHVQNQTLVEAVTQSDRLGTALREGLSSSELASMLGIEVLTINVLSIKATPEMTKALQAETRERVLLKSDEAVYARRNTAIELERQISENQLRSEKAVEEKKREVRQAQMEADIAIESKRADLVDQQVANESKMAKARAEALGDLLANVRTVDWRVLAATLGTMDGKQTMAMAFQQLAENAERVGQLQITPDLLQSILSSSLEKTK